MDTNETSSWIARNGNGRTIASSDSPLDRLPPHSPDMEMGVLGCILLAPNDALPECVEKLKEARGGGGHLAFYDLRHQMIYAAAVAMFDARQPIDLITLQQFLKDARTDGSGMTDLEKAGGIAYLSQLQDTVPSAANLSYYLEKVQEKFLLRKMIQTCGGVISRIYDFEGEVDSLMDAVEKEVLAVNQARAVSGVLPVKDLVNGALTRIENYFNRQGALGGIATGFPDLDKMTDGLQDSEMTVIAARPSLGKTSLACAIAEHAALELGLPVAVFSLEMSADSLMLRMMCSLARVNLRSVRDGFMGQEDFPKLMAAAGRLSAAKLFIDDTAGLTTMQLRARARRLHQQHGIRLFVIDYLQLMVSSKTNAGTRQEEVAEISSGLKAMSKELRAPVVVLAQLNREIEKDKNRKPRMSDLRESGSIEQDADLIGLLYKPADGEEDETTGDAMAVNLVIVKQRNGPTGDVNLTFLRNFTRFESAPKYAAPEN